MKIIEIYGYSCSGKSYLASEIKNKDNLDISFSKISKKNRFVRIFSKFLHFFSIKFSDLFFVLNIHKEFSFINYKYKFKNFFSFIFLIGFIRKNINIQNSIVVDHGIFQCLFSCYIFSKQENINHKKLSDILIEFFLKLPINLDYHAICMKTEIQTIKLRLKNKKNFTNLIFLEKNENKINNAYLNLEYISRLIAKKSINFTITKF